MLQSIQTAAPEVIFLAFCHSYYITPCLNCFISFHSSIASNLSILSSLAKLVIILPSPQTLKKGDMAVATSAAEETASPSLHPHREADHNMGAEFKKSPVQVKTCSFLPCFLSILPPALHAQWHTLSSFHFCPFYLCL